VSVVLAKLSNAKNKGADGAVKSNLVNAIKQGEIFWNTNTASPGSYTGVCTNGTVGGAKGAGEGVLAAAKAVGLIVWQDTTVAASGGNAVCNDGPNDWAAEVPLKAVTGFWCVDNTGRSLQTPVALLTGAADHVCQ
jgi:hypothetical protein